MKKKEEIKRTVIKLNNELQSKLNDMNELEAIEENQGDINILHMAMTELVIKIKTLKWVLKI